MKINSNNEWDKLKTVIVGSAFPEIEFDVDFTFKLFFKRSWGWVQTSEGIPKRIKIKKQYIEELNEDIEEFVKILKNLNIEVLRPKAISKIFKIKTLFSSSIVYPPLNVRDLTLILGNSIIETAPQILGRQFEHDFLKDIFQEAFIDGARWIKMPLGFLQENTIDDEMRKTIDKKREIFYKNGSQNYDDVIISKIDNFDKITRFYDMVIDAAQFVRFGKNIIVNVANLNHYLGYLWFKREFPEYNFHILHSLVDNHLDSYIVPLCEGVLLLRDKEFLKVIPDFLKDWKIIYPPKPKENQFPLYDKDDLILTTPYIDMNVLSIDGKNIIVNSLFPELSEKLYKEGFNPIPVRHRHRRIFGGGFHCFTLDLLREKE